MAKEIQNKHPNARIWRERSWRMSTELLRPDITMVKDNKVFKTEVTILYEKNSEYIEQRRPDKIKKYNQLLQQDGLIQVQCTRDKLIPIVIDALGTIIKNTNKDFHKLGLHQHLHALQMIIATGLVNKLNQLRRADFNQ